MLQTTIAITEGGLDHWLLQKCSLNFGKKKNNDHKDSKWLEQMLLNLEIGDRNDAHYRIVLLV